MEAYMKFKQLFPWVLIFGVLFSACAAVPQAVPEVMVEQEDTMSKEDDAAGMMGESHDEDMASADDMMDKPSGELMMAPEWFSAELVDVHTGERFRVGDLQGQVVLVETMAVWCSNCLRQQREVQALHAALGEREDFISIALDIDPNEEVAQLRDFAARQGFDWLYAVAPVEVANQMGMLYGQQFLNPPSTPILLIDRQGEVHPLPFGIKSAADLQNSVEMLLDAAM
jgi:hypothetical protein